MVEAGPILAAAFLVPIWWTRLCCCARRQAIGADGIDALEGLSLEALTRSPRLASVGTETVGADTVEAYRAAA